MSVKGLLRIVGVVVGIASAGAAWWSFHLSDTYRNTPFTLSVSLGTPVLSASTVAVYDDNFADARSSRTVSVAMSVTLGNSGAQAGCVSDIALSIKSPVSEKQYRLYPTFLVNMAKYLRGIDRKIPLLYSVIGLTRNIVLPGRSTVSRAILFMSNQPLLEIESLSEQGAYEFQMYAIESGVNCDHHEGREWKLFAAEEYVLTNEQLEALKSEMAILPVDRTRDSLREKSLSKP